MHLRITPKKKRNGKTHDNDSNPTKRIILSQVNSIYGRLGLAGPFPVPAKILMRELWGIENKLGWVYTIFLKGTNNTGNNFARIYRR